MTPEPVLFVLDHRRMEDVITLLFRLILVIFFKLLFSSPSCPESKLMKLMKASQQSKRNSKLFEDCPPGVIP